MSMTLSLVLTSHWYNEVESRRKNIEYREIKPYWTKRIWGRRDEIKHVRFSRGYSNISLLREVVKIDIGTCPYDGWDGDYYRLWIK